MVKQIQHLDQVVIRFAGDSGDGMQLTGDRFTQETAALGNDLSTLPNYPSEIRAPSGTVAGVSSYQVKFADHDVLTAGDPPDVLVAMNPAALKANRVDLRHSAIVIVNVDERRRAVAAVRVVHVLPERVGRAPARQQQCADVLGEEDMPAVPAHEEVQVAVSKAADFE